MAGRWLKRLAVIGAVVVGALSVTTNADAADETITLDGPLPVTAAGGSGCTDGAGRPYPGMDLWRFGLPGGVGAFDEIQLGFVTPGGAAISRTIGSSEDGQGREDVQSGIDGAEAWLATNPNWVLVNGTATAHGSSGRFALIAACPATNPAAETLFANAPVHTHAAPDRQSPRALAAGIDLVPTLTLGSSLLFAGVLLLVVRRRPRGRHRN